MNNYSLKINSSNLVDDLKKFCLPASSTAALDPTLRGLRHCHAFEELTLIPLT